MDESQTRRVTRRTALRAIGLGAATGAIFGSEMLTGSAAWSDPLPGPNRPTHLSVEDWRVGRGQRYYIAHRGSGDVFPEHSMPAYRAAVGAGARCMEISVAMTSDGVLICLHDATYDRTTTLTGPVLAQPSSVLAQGRIWQPRLGAYWTRNPPEIPLFEDVLRAFGGQVVLAIEAKVDQAYEPMMAMVERYGLTDTVIVKAHYRSSRWRQAQLAGLPVFCYFGSPVETTIATVTQVGAQLKPDSDCLVIYGFAGGGPYISDAVVSAAVQTGVPVWVHPLHRRSDAEHFFDLGVQGAICSSYGYISSSGATATTDSWVTQAVAPGQMSRDPASDDDAARMTADGHLVLDAKNIQHFMTIGQLGPVAAAAGTYSIDVDAQWLSLPSNSAGALSVAFGRPDDSYYQHRQGLGNGYHAILRATGELGLYRHQDGTTTGTYLGSVATPPLSPGDVAHLRIELDPTRITLRRQDSGDFVTAVDGTVRGGYVHLGRTSPDGVAAFANMAVT